MDYRKPWPDNRPGYQQGPGYRPSQAGAPQRPVYPGAQQQGAAYPAAGPGSLSREERLEAKRLAEEASFSFAGYQVVRREFISHRFDPAMTIRGNSITFNNSCISKLEDATYVLHCSRRQLQRVLRKLCESDTLVKIGRGMYVPRDNSNRGKEELDN